MQRHFTRKELAEQIKKKKSFLCVGLDTDIQKLPSHLGKTPEAVVEFNKQIIEATRDLCVAYKLNTAFYEAMGDAGWTCMKRTIDLIPKDIFVIADAKRGDVGNTAMQYANAFFKELDADAITLSPYMGRDSIEPFLEYKGKWAILLGLTSNEGAKDYQLKKLESGKLFYEEVLLSSAKWGCADNMMYVVGATQAQELKNIRKILPEHFLLIPGVGAQSGDVEGVIRNGATNEGGLLINASRSIIYAGNGKDFADAARKEALKLQKQMGSAFYRGA